MKNPAPKKSSHKILITIGLAALFAVGIAAGIIYSNYNRKASWTQESCDALSQRIVLKSGWIKSYTGELKDMEELNNYKRIYSDNCSGMQKDSSENAEQAKQQQSGPPLPDETCEAIEKIMLQRIDDNTTGIPDAHMFNANTYSTLAEFGCPENHDKFERLAVREIDIARALNDDKFYDDNEKIQIVDIYDKAQMKEEAKKFINKMQKLSDPAIDFIYEAQKIFAE